MVRFWQVSFGLAALGFIIVALLVIAGVDFLYIQGTETSQEDENGEGMGAIYLFVCSPVFLIPTVVFLVIGLIGFTRRRRNREIAELLKSHRRIKVGDFSKKIGKNEMEAEKTIMKILEDKQLEGYMDRGTGEFFTKEFLDQTPNVRFGWKCDSCGAKNDSVILPGEMGKCKYCNSPVAPIGGDQPKEEKPPRSQQNIPTPAPQVPPQPSPQTFWLCPVCGARNFSYIQPGQTGTCFNCNTIMEPASG